MNAYLQKEQAPSQKDNTGIPAQMKKKFERSSGFSFDDVRVHYNSEKPAQLHAHAYTQGNEVYVAPGQEKHLPHELGHVVQQKSNAVTPTGEISGMPLNDDEAMESGADRLAEEAESSGESGEVPLQAKAKDGGVVQRADLASEGAYNFNAGFMSSLIGGAGVIGGIASAIAGLVSYNHASKEKYVGQIEKYTDDAEDACNEAEASYYEMLNTDDAAQKTKKAIETKKHATKAKQLALNACNKYNVKRNMKNSRNANFAKEKADSIVTKAQAYIAEADGAITHMGINTPQNQLGGAQVQGAQVQGAQVQGAQVQGAQVHETPALDTPVLDTPVLDTPVLDTPAPVVPSEEGSMEELSLDESPPAGPREEMSDRQEEGERDEQEQREEH